jgi:hypothetical protein
MRAFSVRPSPLFAPSSIQLAGLQTGGYRAARDYHERSAWVGQGLGTAYRWWRGEQVKIVDGNPYCLTEVADPSAEGVPVIETGLRTFGGELVWRLIDEDTPSIDVITQAYVDRMAAYGERRGLEALPDGDYCLTADLGDRPRLVPRWLLAYLDVPRDYDGVRDFLDEEDIPGLLFADEDGREATVFRADFGPASSGRPSA